MTDAKLEIRGLSKHFVVHIRDGLRVEALSGISLSVGRGEFLGLVGRSGSGKSSLLKCLYRSYLPDSGRAIYAAPGGDSTDLAAADEHTILRLRRGAIGYVSQALRVIPRVTVEQTVARAAPQGAVDRLGRARDLLSRLNLAEPLWGSFPALLSGGEQQRVNIARALIAEPDLLLLDEPTSALDAANQAAVVELLQDQLDRGTTIVGVFHDAPGLHRIVHRTAQLDHGRLTAITPAGGPVHAGGAQ